MISVDGNHRIGMGHFYRSVNLAINLRKNNHKVVFLTRDSTVKELLPKSFKCQLIKKYSLLKQKKIIDELKSDVIIIDKLKEKTKTIKMLQKICKNVIAIDYIGKNKKIIENSINMLYPISGNTTGSFSGFKFAILNEKFLKTKPIIVKKKINSLLVIQGGSDTHCFIPKIINALNHLKESMKISVVLGPSFNCWNNLRKALKNNTKPLKIYHDVKNMSSLMSKHDIAITGGGMTLLELSYLGIPSIIICGENFENETATLMQKKGFGINLGYNSKLSENKITSITNELITNYNIRKRMNTHGKRIVDGKGLRRVSKVIMSFGV